MACSGVTNINSLVCEIAGRDVIITFWDPLTNFRTTTMFDSVKKAIPEHVAKVAQSMLEKVPDPRVKAQERLPTEDGVVLDEVGRLLDTAGVVDGHNLEARLRAAVPAAEEVAACRRDG